MMHTSVSRFARNEKGATAVEFAIILPVLLLFVFGIIEWGLYMYNRQVITNAAREGARYGVLTRMIPRNITDPGEDPAIKDKVLEFASSYLVTFGDDELDAEEDITITRNPPSEPFKFGTNLTVEFYYEYDFLFLKIPPLNLGPLPIKGASTMRME